MLQFLPSLGQLQWHRIKNGRREEHIPVDHRHQLVENARVLRITEVNKEQDEADYRCNAKLGEMEDDITISLKVSRKSTVTLVVCCSTFRDNYSSSLVIQEL